MRTRLREDQIGYGETREQRDRDRAFQRALDELDTRIRKLSSLYLTHVHVTQAGPTGTCIPTLRPMSVTEADDHAKIKQAMHVRDMMLAKQMGVPPEYLYPDLAKPASEQPREPEQKSSHEETHEEWMRRCCPNVVAMMERWGEDPY